MTGRFQTIYIGEAAPPGIGWLGEASRHSPHTGAVDYDRQIPDDTAVVFVNNILNDAAYEGKAPSSLSEDQIVNGIASIVAQESGLNLGLFPLPSADGDYHSDARGDVQRYAPRLVRFAGGILAFAYQVYQYTSSPDRCHGEFALRLQYTTGPPANPSGPAVSALIRCCMSSITARSVRTSVSRRRTL